MDGSRTLERTLLAAAIVIGVVIAYVDSRPSWDDAGVTAFSMLLVAGVFALLVPRRPWRWALAVGIWIPIYAFVRAPAAKTFAMLIVLIFPFAGAYAGMAIRRLIATV